MLFFQIMVVPTLTFSVCGLKAKPLLSTIVTFMIVGVGVGGVAVGLGFGVGVGVALVGVGVGVFLVGVGVGFALVGVGLGLDCVGVTPGCVDVGEGALFVVLTVFVEDGVLVTTLLLPPQLVSTTRRETIQMPHKAMRRGK